MALCVLSGSGVLVDGTVCTFRVCSTCLWHCMYFQGLQYLFMALYVLSGSGVLVEGPPGRGLGRGDCPVPAHRA